MSYRPVCRPHIIRGLYIHRPHPKKIVTDVDHRRLCPKSCENRKLSVMFSDTVKKHRSNIYFSLSTYRCIVGLYAIMGGGGSVSLRLPQNMFLHK